MSALPLLLGWLLLAAEPTAAAPRAGYLPAGTPAELHDLGRLALLRDPRIQVEGFGSRHALGVRDGRTVLAEVAGPGVLQRIWIAEPGRAAELRNGRLRVTIDRAAEPVVDATVAELCAGGDPRFPDPMVGARPGGFVCDVPIPFRDGCLVTLEGAGAAPYEVSVLKLPTAEGLTSFRARPTAEEANDLQLAQALWREPEATFSDEPSFSPRRLWRALSIRRQTEDAEYAVAGDERSTRLFALPAGPRTIRSFDLSIDPKTLDNWRSARLRIVWEGTEPASAAVDVPLSEFFALPAQGITYRSLVTGENENVWSNRLPMPYQRAASVVIDAEGPIRGMLRVRTVRGTAPHAAYLRAYSRSATGPAFTWGPEPGRGHLVGTYVTMAGRGERADSLVGALTLLADDRPLFVHGTPLVQAFGAAWPNVPDRLDLAQTYPLSGFPRFQRTAGRWHVAAYRWRLTDPVPFEHSIALRIEPDNAPSATPADDVRATIFWYSERSGPTPTGRLR